MEKVKDLFELYRKLKKFTKKTTGGYWKAFYDLSSKLNKLFDIRTDAEHTKVHESFWGIKMCQDDYDYYEDQKADRKMYSTKSVDPKWKKHLLRKINRMDRKRSEAYADTSFQGDVSFDDDGSHPPADQDEEFVPENTETDSPKAKKKRYEFIDTFPEEDDQMPDQFKYPRHGPRSVKSELYMAIHILKAKYHMSAEQIEGSIVTVANLLFGRNWNVYSPNQDIDKNSLPSMSNARRTEKLAEAQVLSEIAEEMMSTESPCVVYSNDGSSQSRTGSYVVQSFTINGKQRTLPTLPICSESKENLTDLIIATCKMLSAATGNKYSPSEIFSKVDFVMTDSTAHNHGVAELVTEKLQLANTPSVLFCNAHPLLMMQTKIKEVCQQIHDGIGKKRIKECFMVDIDFHNESFVLKAIKCLTNFINRECSSKPWNRSEHFSDFIKPKKNMSISLKDHRFNRLNDCALTLLYHLDDIAAYLEKYQSVINGISILDRTFVDMDILKPIFNAIALIGIHVSRPFHNMIMDLETNYSTLRVAYPKLYEELLEIDTVDVLQPDIQVFKFVSHDLFKNSLPDENLLKSLQASIQCYPDETKSVLKLMLKMIADGLHHQKGSIFSFGPSKDSSTAHNVLKFSDVSESQMNTLDQYVSVHNIGEERNVGLVNYELHIRGKEHLKSVSQKLVINKSSDLLSTEPLKKFRKGAKMIESLKVDWTSRMQKLQAEGFEQQDIINVKKDTSKLKDLEYLKSQNPVGPFTSCQEVENFMETTLESKSKNDRLYREVRYARNTCLSMANPSKFFKLRKDNQNLLSEEYAACLISYFDNSRSLGKLTLSDLKNVIGGIHSVVFGQPAPPSSAEMGDGTFFIGEHVIVAWLDQCYDWELGVIEKHTPAITLVSHLVSTNKSKNCWVFPEEARVLAVASDQILLKNVQVSYHQSIRIKLTINEDTVLKANEELAKLASN